MKKKLFKRMFLWTFLLVGCATFAQSVTGNVSDQDGPLPGANVILKGTANGTTTDFDGNFTLNNVPSDGVLVISYLGYVSQEVNVNGQSTISVTLAADASELDEIVVVAYGTQSRATVTGAISSIDSEELTALPVATAGQALQGRASGVTVVNNGSPGTGPTIKIRGLGTVNDSNPLYVIDGVISSGLGDLNASDIESINVLKDASTTAAYGSQASNGVVIVTTKKGRSGKTQISLNAYTGVQNISNRYDLLNTQQYLQYASEAFGVVPTSALSSSGLNTDWQDEIFRSGLMQNYDLSISGGGENSNYRVSMGYADQEGAIIETGFERYSFRANSNFSLNDKFKVGETLALSFNKMNPELQAGGRSLIEHAIKSAPYLPVYNSDNLGGFQGPSGGGLDGQDAENPVRAQTLGEAINKSVGITGSIFGEYEIIEGLKFKTQVGLEYRTYNNNRFVPSYNDDSEGTGTHGLTYATITKNSGTFQTVLFTNSLNYEKTFNDVHNLQFLLLAEKYENKITNLATSSRNNISDDINEVSNSSGDLSSNSDKTVKIGYLGRLNYNYDGKYILAASLRRDASSKFGANNQWGWFPSVALGWNIAKEDFMADSNFSNLKLRGSWGVVGNDKTDSYEYQATITQSFNYPINNVSVIGSTPANIANADLKWEETTMVNIGLDFGLFDEKITGSLEYYNNTSDDLLFKVPLANSLGITSGIVTKNVGSVETKGFELNLGYNDYDGDFTWSANLNLGTSKNVMKDLNGNGGGVLSGPAFEGDVISRTSVGESMFYFYGLEMEGVFQNQAEVDQVLFGLTDGNLQTGVTPGDVRYKDQNGDGFINDSDRVKIGNPFPELTYGLNLNANYKNWDFNAFITGVAGNDLYNTNIYDLEGMPRLFNAGTAVLNRWTGEGTSNSIPQAGGNVGNNTEVSDRFVEDGAFTRLKNLSIGYTLNDLSENISKLRIYISGQNLITLTDYSGLDPEVGASTVINGDGRFELGIDRGNYPQPKSFLLGVQLSF